MAKAILNPAGKKIKDMWVLYASGAKIKKLKEYNASQLNIINRESL